MSKNLLLYLIANALTIIGSWVHYVALYWLVFQITHSPIMLGIVSLTSCMPILLFSFLGGAISDRLPRKALLISLQFLSGLTAITMSILSVNSISIITLLLFGIIFGILSSLESPVKQTFIPNLIEKKENISKAISWNAIVNHIARIIGPLICSLFLVQDKIYIAFAIDGLTYFISAFIIVFVCLNNSEKTSDKSKKTIAMLKEGFGYIFKRKILFYTIITSSICAFCIGPYTAQIPSLVNEAYPNKNDSLFIFYVITGFGGLASALFLRFIGTLHNKPPKSFFFGFLVAAIALCGFLLGYSIYFGYVALFFITFGVVLATGSALIYIQNYIDDEFRGRVMGFYQMLTIGMLPISNSVFGVLCELFTVSNTFYMSAMLSTTAIVILFVYAYFENILRREYIVSKI